MIIVIERKHETQPPTNDDAIRDINQEAILLAVANPARMRILGLLRNEGERTVGQICELLGMAPGSVSFHLRKLADAGMAQRVEQIDGDGRKSWWKATYQAMRPARHGNGTSGSDAEYAYRRAVAVTYESIYERYLDAMPDLPSEWRETGLSEDRTIDLTPEEAEKMSHEFDELAGRWASRSRDRTAGGNRRKVALIIQAFPWIP
jgi:DNA-binding transcriptional ArsR family regulator